MDLIIVESPTKAKTITNYAGNNFKVVSSKGHIYDLPKKTLGINIENNFEPEFNPIPSKKQIINEIKKAVKKADNIYIATDPDREGEAIAYFIKQIIDEEKQEKTKRVLFFEITQKGIKNGLNNPRNIDMCLVNSQFARRILDRLVGYKLSPFLWRAIKSGLSAGRVQSVALRLICEREKKINKFKPKEFFKINAIFEYNKKMFNAELIKYDNKKIADIKETQETIKNTLLKGEYFVIKYKNEIKKQHALPPFITSTLQQAGSNIYNFSAKRTMKIAQSLYEGVKIDKKLTGLITYMRTDSTRISEDALNSIRERIQKNLGKAYLPTKVNIYKKSKQSQDAHEAIRPADINILPDDIKEYLNNDQYKLYSLIWKRTMASQMTPAEYSNSKAEIASNGHIFKAEGNVLLFDGFLNLYPYAKSRDTKNTIPELEINKKVILNDLKISKEQTKPPSRYSEAMLIKTLENKGIGRPSTYASIIDTIVRRNYVEKEKKTLKATELGMIVNKILMEYFPNIMDIGFTANMEKELDLIVENKRDYKDVLNVFYNDFKKYLDSALDKAKHIKKSLEKTINEKCPKCGNDLVEKWGRFGKFIACSNYPECKYKKTVENESIDEKCPKCGAELNIKNGRFGKFIACSNYPKCKYTKSISSNVKCPECKKGELVERRTAKGRLFYSCNRYPQCKFAIWNKPIPIECPECKNEYMIEKNGYYVCPKCKHKIKPE